jgi:hypothetical protein
MNRLTGTIPQAIGDLTALTNLCVVGRCGCSASPHSNRRFLQINNLTGTIPGNIFKSTTLQNLCVIDRSFNHDGALMRPSRRQMSANSLTGTIPPAAVGALSMLEYL